MRFVIVTGMSGAGKSTALKMLEDAEYFCVDNLPIPLVEKFAQLTADGTSGEIQKVAVGIDIRSGQALPDLQNVLEWMSINGICYEILFLDASDDVLVKRYKETRRTHPLAGLGRVDEGIRKERKALEFLKKDADYILDTSQLLTRELKAELDKIFVQDQKFKNLMNHRALIWIQIRNPGGFGPCFRCAVPAESLLRRRHAPALRQRCSGTGLCDGI